MTTQHELESYVNQLTSFDGDLLDQYTALATEFYNGQNGIMTAQQLLDDATARNRVFTLTVSHTEATTQYFFLCPSYLVAPSTNGHPLSGKSTEGNAMNFLGSQPLGQFYGFIDKNPLSIVGIRLTAKTNPQVAQTLELKRFSDPFAQPETDAIILSARQSELVQQLNIVTVPLSGVVFDSQTQVKVPILKGEEVVITIFCGPALNTGEALRKISAPAVSIPMNTAPAIPAAVNRMDMMRARIAQAQAQQQQVQQASQIKWFPKK